MPAGMQRIGYDSDTQRYTFRDSDGCIYEGTEYGGMLTLVSRPQKQQGVCWSCDSLFLADTEGSQMMNQYV